MRQEPDPVFNLLRRSLGIDNRVEDLDGPAFIGQDPRNRFHQAALAGSVRTDQAVNLALANFKIDTLHRHLFLVALDEAGHGNDGIKVLRTEC